MAIDDNPFEKWDLDPFADRKSLTEAMRRRARQLDSEERQKLQSRWRELMSDPVARARWTALTPPPIAGERSPWEAAQKAVRPSTPPAEFASLRPTLEDALVLPLMSDDRVYASPPFLPALLKSRLDARQGIRRGDDGHRDEEDR